MRIHYIQHVPFESPGSLLDWALQKKAVISVSEMFNNGGFPAPGPIDLLVIMGGPMGVSDTARFPWLEEEKRFIRKVLSSGTRLLGICLGAQLLADALGAKVYPNDQKEIGWFPVEQTEVAVTAGNLMEGLPAAWTSFHWHGDTFDLPEGSIHLFRSRACRHQGFLMGKQVLALQFHPEVTPALVQAMVANGSTELVPAPYVQSVGDLITPREYYPVNQAYLFGLLNRFLELS